MRTRWHFIFETKELAIGRSRTFRGTVPRAVAARCGYAEQEIPFAVQIVPDNEPRMPAATSTGMAFLELPGTESDSENLAIALVTRVATQISFDQRAEFRVHLSLRMGERLPENCDEAATIAKQPYFAHFSLVEVSPSPSFDGGTLTAIQTNPFISQAIRQHNAARMASTAVDRYLGYFKVLEHIYCRDSKDKVAVKLRASNQFHSIAQGARELGLVPSDLPDCEAIIRSLLSARDQCAHLRGAAGQGILPDDPVKLRELDRILPLAEWLSHEAIKVGTLEQEASSGI